MVINSFIISIIGISCIIITLVILLILNNNNTVDNNDKIKTQFINKSEQLDETNPYNKALYYGYQMIKKFKVYSDGYGVAVAAANANAAAADAVGARAWDTMRDAAGTGGDVRSVWKLIIQAYFISYRYDVTVDTDDINILTDPEELVKYIKFN